MNNDKQPSPITGVSRREAVQSVAAAAAFAALVLKAPNAAAQCVPSASALNYGPLYGNPLTDANIARLFAAWLILTTNAPDQPTSALIQGVADLKQETADAIIEVYNACPAFQQIRQVFGYLAYSFIDQNANPPSLYSGGQCPEKIDTINSVTKVDGITPTSSCKVKKPSMNIYPIPDCFPADVVHHFQNQTNRPADSKASPR